MALIEKSVQERARGAFTRAKHILTSHIQKGVEEPITQTAKICMDNCFLKLEEAFDKYIYTAQINLEED